ncbi:hypothetical protein BG261_02695 [Floricoccus tropicus]|uniref:Major facilitator superfamily (MFS) profile domain-containing protein n=1 Tax=Floricoccus tropicus TaxID=1859473 RepID=A0A1E8GNC9_9LACT|nr:MFS transporter [Floricoccus tropicus]OFI49506.1 hypothetical protein BG261_02695 [Floricoccus tropicus]
MKVIKDFRFFICLTVTCLYGIVINSLRNSFQFFLGPIADYFHTSSTNIALSSGMLMLTSGISSLFAGWLLDKVGVKKTLLYGNLVIILSLSLSLLTKDYHLFNISFGLLGGFGYGMSWGVVTQYYISKKYPEQKGFALSMLANCNAFGLALFSPLWTSLASTNSWKLGYKIILFSFIIIAPINIFLLGKTDKQVEPRKIIKSDSWILAFKNIFSSSKIKFSILSSCICGMSMGIMDTNLVLLMKNELLNKDIISRLMSTFGLFVIIGGISVGILSDKLFKNRKNLLLILLILRTIAFILMITPIAPLIKFSFFVFIFGITYSGILSQAAAIITGESISGVGKLLSINMLLHQISGMLGVLVCNLSLKIFNNYNLVLYLVVALTILIIMYGYTINKSKSRV